MFQVPLLFQRPLCILFTMMFQLPFWFKVPATRCEQLPQRGCARIKASMAVLEGRRHRRVAGPPSRTLVENSICRTSDQSHRGVHWASQEAFGSARCNPECSGVSVQSREFEGRRSEETVRGRRSPSTSQGCRVQSSHHHHPFGRGSAANVEQCRSNAMPWQVK